MNPDERLTVVRLPAPYDAPTPPPDAQIRRAISTAYYAAFHAALTTAAERFLGSDGLDSPGHRLIYRGFDHRRMKEICEAVYRPTLNAKHQAALGRARAS